MRLKFFDQSILLIKSLFPFLGGTEGFSSPQCIVVGRIHAEAKWVPPGWAWRLNALFRPADVLRAVLKWIKVSFTCFRICLDKETRCQEPFGGTVTPCRKVPDLSLPSLHPILSPALISQALLPGCRGCASKWDIIFAIMPKTSQITHSKPLVPIYMNFLIC